MFTHPLRFILSTNDENERTDDVTSNHLCTAHVAVATRAGDQENAPEMNVDAGGTTETVKGYVEPTKGGWFFGYLKVTSGKGTRTVPVITASSHDEVVRIVKQRMEQIKRGIKRRTVKKARKSRPSPST